MNWITTQPSPFLLEAFDSEELAPSIRGRAA